MQFSDLDRTVRGRLRTLSKDNAEQVGLHLIMTGRLLDTDPELAYEHAQAAVRRAGRVDVVREAAGLAAYRTGRFAEALRELRTVRRLNGSSEHLAIMADCERGLGRPERAIALAASEEAEGLDPQTQVELAMVVSGARLDLAEPEAALAVLSMGAPTRVEAGDRLLGARVAQARASALEALGRHDDAAAALATYSAADLAAASGEVGEDVVVFDLAEDEDEAPTAAAGHGAADRPGAPADDDEDGGLDAAAAPVDADDDDRDSAASAADTRDDHSDVATSAVDQADVATSAVDQADVATSAVDQADVATSAVDQAAVPETDPDPDDVEHGPGTTPDTDDPDATSAAPGEGRP